MTTSKSMWLLLACALGACEGGRSAAPPALGGTGAMTATPPGPDGTGGMTASADGAAGAAGSDGAATVSPGAVYVVPASADTPEGRYPIDAPMTEISTDEFRLDYNLPKLLVGGDQPVSLRGTLDAAGRIATISGDAGTAICDRMPGNGLLLRCTEALTGVKVDLAEVEKTARDTDPDRVAFYVPIADRFSSEPIGVLEVR
jgi:hypothetical protein